MIISPPFLPERSDAETDAAWVEKAMAQPSSRAPGSHALEGSFPLSAALMWHNGQHIQAPKAADGSFLPVRAIADGKIVYAKAGTAKNASPDDPQNYSPAGPGWTDNGIVIIEHETEIGASNDTPPRPTTIKYYSVYMHLSAIAKNATTKAPWKAGDRIYRKDELGRPGEIYGNAGQIHFEICCDEANATAIIGRKPGWTDTEPAMVPTANGRTDSVFGDIHIYLPASTPTMHPSAPAPAPAGAAAPTSASKPRNHLRATGGTTLGAAHWVSIRYDKGTAYLRSHDALGAPIGKERSDPDFEYDLYKEAAQRHASLGANAQGSSPSGWYELLRFGRNLGPDPLPANAAHWRLIPTADGEVWADLNAAGSFKFSDADFLSVMGWNCFDDDNSPNDQRCDSLRMKCWIRDPNAANAKRMEQAELARRLGDAGVRKKLRRAICNFPSEWEQGTVEARHLWLRDKNLKYQLDDDRNWRRFVDHCKLTTFADLPGAYVAAGWRFHPVEFITLMRRCGWLSDGEMRQLLPQHAMRTSNGVTLWEDVPAKNADFRANPIARDHRVPLNRAMRKWGIDSPIRAATLFGNSLQETMWLGTLVELGGSTYWYAPWHGRGFLQLTHPDNYMDYWSYRGRVVQDSVRRPILDAHGLIRSKPFNLRKNIALQDDNFAGFTNEMKLWRAQVEAKGPVQGAENTLAPSDSAGFYWAKLKMSKEADKTHLLEKVEIVTNKGRRCYYRSQAFWRASATVNLPASVNAKDYKGINGFDARCVAYGYALAVLTETRFENEAEIKTLFFPMGHLPRRSAT